MVKRVKEGEEAGYPKSGAQFAGNVKDSAQQIWLAGLGAFSRAQEEGSKVFEALVKEGVTIQRKTQAAAEERFGDAGARMASMASGFSGQATGQWDKLGSIFEDRVARALRALGVPSAEEVATLAARVEELEQTVAKLRAGTSAATPRRVAKTAGKHEGKAPGATAKPARKRPAARKSAP
jgi:poly(hydroxyalkanoate) granule-associated protein